MIDESYVPAVITAVAGILGILINLLIEVHYKNLDKKIKEKEKMQINLEVYYLPFAIKISEISSMFATSGLKKERVLEFLCNSKVPSAKDEKIIENIKKSILETYKYIRETNFKYIDDILLYKYFTKAKDIIGLLGNSIIYKEMINGENIDMQYFDLYVNRVNDRVFYYNSGGFLHYWYYKRKGEI